MKSFDKEQNDSELLNELRSVYKKEISEDITLLKDIFEKEKIEKISNDVIKKILPLLENDKDEKRLELLIENKLSNIKIKSGKDGLQGIPGKDGLQGIPGKDGKDGLNGIDGKSFSYLGEFENHPDAEIELSFYRNTKEKVVYIYTNNQWVVLIRDGVTQRIQGGTAGGGLGERDVLTLIRENSSDSWKTVSADYYTSDEVDGLISGLTISGADSWKGVSGDYYTSDEIDILLSGVEPTIDISGYGNIKTSADESEIKIYTTPVISADGFYLTTDLPLEETVETGRTRWCTRYNTPVTGLLHGVQLNNGQELLPYVFNNTGQTLYNGDVVFIEGAHGDHVAVELATSVIEETNRWILGVVTQDEILSNEKGYVTVFGIIHEIPIPNLDWEERQLLCLSVSAGKMTNIFPPKPYQQISLGYVQRTIGNGSGKKADVFIKPLIIHPLSKVSDVLITSATDGDTLVRENGLWINRNYGQITKDDTGFRNNSDIDVSYDPTTKTVSLSGDLESYWRGNRVYDLSGSTW